MFIIEGQSCGRAKEKTIKCFVSLVVWYRNRLSDQVGGWTSGLGFPQPERTGSSEGQLQLKKAMQKCPRCQDTATRAVSCRFILFSLFHLKKMVDNCFRVEQQATALPEKVACHGAQRLGKLTFSSVLLWTHRLGKRSTSEERRLIRNPRQPCGGHT